MKQLVPVAAMAVLLTHTAHGQSTFDYFAAGSLKPKTAHGAESVGDTKTSIVDTTMRFPIEAPPAFANSQVFAKGGNCYGRGKNCPYDLVKLVNGQWQAKFSQKDSENFKYPWRDNFCEDRGYVTILCAAGGNGHQGQDIRPKTAEIDKYAVVAVHDGTVSWQSSNLTLTRVVQPSDGPSYRVNYIYRHVNPNRKLVASGRVKQGQRLAYVGNFQGDERTTVHLHFEIVMPFVHKGKTRIGVVNPYKSLVGAYERLLGAQGKELTD